MTNGQTMHTLPGAHQFPTTRWTLVVAAGDPHRKEARSALVSLCENYWYPLYAYLRRRGHPADQAQDLTQGFFIRRLEGRYLDRADPEKGRSVRGPVLRSRPRIEGHATTSVVVVAGFPAGQASARALGLLARDSLKLVPQGVLSWQPPLQVVEEILEEGDVN